MTNLAQKPPLGLKPDRAEKPKRKGVKPVSDKRRQHRASPDGQEDLEHMGCVKTCPCSGCGATGINEAHHCRDMPPFHLQFIYDRLPGAGMKSADTDTIPLCPECHVMFHENRSEFHRRYGQDHLYILPTRALVAALLGEIDF